MEVVVVVRRSTTNKSCRQSRVLGIFNALNDLEMSPMRYEKLLDEQLIDTGPLYVIKDVYLR